MVLSPYLYLFSFSLSCCTFFDIITSSFSPFQVHIFLWGKTILFVSFKHIPSCNFFLCPVRYLASPFLFIIISFLSVFSKLFINIYFVIDLVSVCVCVAFKTAFLDRQWYSGQAFGHVKLGSWVRFPDIRWPLVIIW